MYGFVSLLECVAVQHLWPCAQSWHKRQSPVEAPDKHQVPTLQGYLVPPRLDS